MPQVPPINTDYNEDDRLPPHIELHPTFDSTDPILHSLSIGDLTVIIPESHFLYAEAERALSPRYKRNFAALKQWLGSDGEKYELEHSYAVYRDELGLKLRLFATSKEYKLEDRGELEAGVMFDASHVVVVEAGEEDSEETPTQAKFGNQRPIGWI